MTALSPQPMPNHEPRWPSLLRRLDAEYSDLAKLGSVPEALYLGSADYEALQELVAMLTGDRERLMFDGMPTYKLAGVSHHIGWALRRPSPAS